MTVTLTIDHPNFPDDAEFGLSGLGRIKNRGTLVLDDDQVASFEKKKGMTVADAFKSNALITVSGSQETPKAQQENVQQETVETPDTVVEPPQAESTHNEGGEVSG